LPQQSEYYHCALPYYLPAGRRLGRVSIQEKFLKSILTGNRHNTAGDAACLGPEVKHV